MTPTPARRGDLVVVQAHHSEAGGYDNYRVGIVTSIARDGHVRKFREASSDTAEDLNRYVGFKACYVIPATRVDVEAALAAAAANPWPWGDTTGKPYYSLGEVQAAISPHVYGEASRAHPADVLAALDAPIGTDSPEPTGDA
jgi:hypothetical protein